VSLAAAALIANEVDAAAEIDNDCFGSEADVPADGTARPLDYQELTSPTVEADVRLGPEAEVGVALGGADHRARDIGSIDAYGCLAGPICGARTGLAIP
jgi:hypothetical protein